MSQKYLLIYCKKNSYLFLSFKFYTINWFIDYFVCTANNDVYFRWREVSLMLSKHTQILEILEIPQLMNTCVRNGYYSEALQLCSYVDRLDKRYAVSIPVISVCRFDIIIDNKTKLLLPFGAISCTQLQIKVSDW